MKFCLVLRYLKQLLRHQLHETDSRVPLLPHIETSPLAERGRTASVEDPDDAGNRKKIGIGYIR